MSVVLLTTTPSVGAQTTPTPPPTAGDTNPFVAPRVCPGSEGGGPNTLQVSWPGSALKQRHYARVWIPHEATLRFGVWGEAQGDGLVYWGLSERSPGGEVGQTLRSEGMLLGYVWDPLHPIDTGPDFFSWTNTGPSRTVYMWVEINLLVLVSQMELSNYSVRIEGGNGEAGPPCEGGWDTDQAPPPGHCVTVATGSVSRAGRCFTSPSGVDSYLSSLGYISGLSGPAPEGSVTVGVPSCSAEWISLAGSWLQGATGEFASDCPLVITGNPGRIKPGDTAVLYSRNATTLPVDEHPSLTVGNGILLLDRDLPAGGYSTSSFSFGGSMPPEPATVGEMVRVPIGGPGPGAPDVKTLVTATAYSVSSDTSGHPGRSVELTGWRPGDVIAVPTVPDNLHPVDPHVVEQDVIWTWIDHPDGTSGVIDPGEPYDILIRPILQPLRLVALGDSYAAGEGATDSQLDKCARSTFSYSGRIDQERLYDHTRQKGMSLSQRVGNESPTMMYRSGNGYEWAYIACGGAVTRNIWSDEWFPSPADPRSGFPEPQKPGLSPDDETQLRNPALDQIQSPNAVTLTIGGNDAGFAALLGGCYANSLLAKLPRLEGPNELPETSVDCAEIFQAITEVEGRAFNPEGLTAEVYLEQVLRPRLRETYRQVRARFPEVASGNAVVTVFGYPTLLTESTIFCWESTILGDPNVAWLRTMVAQFNEVIRAEVAAAGFIYVDPAEFAGHEICTDTPPAYINGVVHNFDQLKPADKSFHPSDEGWQAYAEGWIRKNQGDGTRLANGMLAPPTPTELPGATTSPPEVQTSGASVPAGSTQASVVFGMDPIAVCGADQIPSSTPVSFTVAGVAPESTVYAVTAKWRSTDVVTATATAADSTGSAEGVVPVAGFQGPITMMVVGIGADGRTNVLDSADVRVVDGAPPCAQPDRAEPPIEPALAVIDVLANDTAGSWAWDPSSVSIVEGPRRGTATVAGGLVSYQPDEGVRYVDHLTYRACDTTATCSTAIVTIDYTGGCTVIGDGAAAIEGTDGDDVICGTPAAETIRAGAGDDIVYPGGGADTVDMGDGGGTVYRHAETSLVIATAAATLSGSPGLLDPIIVPLGRPRPADDHVVVATTAAVVRPLANDQSSVPLDPGTFALTSLSPGVSISGLSVRESGLQLTMRTSQPVTAAALGYRICDVSGRCGSARIHLTTGTVSGSPPVASYGYRHATPGSLIRFPLSSLASDPDGDLDPESLRVLSGFTSWATAKVDGDAVVLEAAHDIYQLRSGSALYEICDLSGQCTTEIARIMIDPAAQWVGAPEVIGTSPGDQAATISWTPPVETYGSTITGYLVRAHSYEPTWGLVAEQTVDADTTSLTLIGLTNGIYYNLDVRAIVEDGSTSGPSTNWNGVANVFPGTVPSAPAVGAPTRGDGTVRVSWTPPHPGTSEIYGYTVTAVPEGGAGEPTVRHSGGTSTSTTFSNLVPGRAYTFEVRAQSNVGIGPASDRTAPVTVAVLPDGPASVAAVVGPPARAVTLTWTSPGADGWSPITSYRIVGYRDASSSPSLVRTASAGATSLVVTGLSVGSTYRFEVQAVNAIGRSDSTPTEEVAPIATAVPPVITPGAAGVIEGDVGTTTVYVPVRLSFATTVPVTVSYATLDTGAAGIATAGVDYVATSGTVTFAPGETSKIVAVTVIGDTVSEDPLLYGEWILVVFSGPSAGATLDLSFYGLGIGVIIDDD